MKYLIKAVAYAVWALAFGISIALALEFHDGQNKIAIALALLALALSAFGLLFARDAWSKRAIPECIFGLAMWAAGAGFFTITELGYWDSSYSQRYAEFQQAKLAEVRQEGIKDLKWKALTTGEFPPSPEQVDAEIKAAQMTDRWSATKGCTEATAPASKEFCKSYYELQSKLAASRQRADLEKQFTTTAADQKGKLVHNLLAGADVIARRFEIDHRMAADIVIFAAWILLLLARDLGALVADPIGARRKPIEARTAPEATKGTQTAAEPSSPASATQQEPEHTIKLNPEEFAAFEAALDAPPAPKENLRAALSRKAPWDDDPTPPKGTRKPVLGQMADAVRKEAEAAPQPEAKVAAARLDLVVDNDAFFEPQTKAERREKRIKKKEKRLEGSVTDWLGDCTTQTPNDKIHATSDESWSSYLAWCRLNDHEPIGRKKMSRIMRAKLRPNDKDRGPRNGKGAVWPGLIVTMPYAEPMRKRA